MESSEVEDSAVADYSIGCFPRTHSGPATPIALGLPVESAFHYHASRKISGEGRIEWQANGWLDIKYCNAGFYAKIPPFLLHPESAMGQKLKVQATITIYPSATQPTDCASPAPFAQDAAAYTGCLDIMLKEMVFDAEQGLLSESGFDLGAWEPCLAGRSGQVPKDEESIIMPPLQLEGNRTVLIEELPD